jgi:5-methyltetrahydrofolate--homocysteine methyltransferase
VSHMRKNVFYCATAMDGVNVMNEIVGASDPAPILEKNFERLVSRYERAERRAKEDEELRRTLPRRIIDYEKHRIPEQPWFAPETVELSLVEFRPHIDKRNLFSLNWKFGGKSKYAKQGTTEEDLERLFLEWTEKADAEGWLRPQGVISCFPCYSDGDDLVVLDIEDHSKEIARFDFDVVIGAGKEDTICGAQYFYPKDLGKLDAVGLQISSTGPKSDAQLEAFKAEGDSESALYLQGLSDRLAEDMAEYLHNLLRERMGLSDMREGTRWSPGYPAITNVDNNLNLHKILEAGKRIGAKVTDAGEFFPTGCTAAIVSFHPDARYS